MRRLVWLVLAATVVLCGCGTERPGAARADASSSPTPSPTSATPTDTPTPTSTPTPSTAADQHGALAGFPLAMGFPDRNENDGSPVVVTGRPATRAFALCGRTVWDPYDGTTGVIGVDWNAEAEWSRGRTLVLYPSTDAASRAVSRARTALMNCPIGHGDDAGYPSQSELNYYAGDQSEGWIDRYWSGEINGYDTGLTVYHEVRVGRAVLFTYEYTEANGSDAGRDEEIAHAAKEDQVLIDELGTITDYSA